MENIFWTGYSNEERLSALITIKGIIALYGDIVDFKPFSDISLTMVLEVEELKIDKLYDALAAHIGISPFEYLHSWSKRERTIYLNINFARGSGNLKIEVPAVPG